jgi:hypothetical protein
VQRPRGHQKEALRQLTTVSKEAERERVLREHNLKEVNDCMLLLLDEAKEAAAASEERVLAELGKEVEAAAQREKTTALRVSELEEQQRDMSLTGICKKILPCEELDKLQSTRFNLNSFGDSESVDKLHPKRQSVLGNTVNHLLHSALAAAHPRDPNGALVAAISRRGSTKSTVGAAIAGAAEAVRTGAEAGNEEGGGGGGGVANVLSRAYINAKKARDECAANQHLSMLVSLQGMTEARVMEMCSERTPLVPGMTVVVIQLGNYELAGVFESLVSSSSSSSSNSSNTTTTSVSGSSNSNSSGSALLAALVTGVGVGVVDASRVYFHEDVRCTQHAIREAKFHARGKSPGARVQAATNDHCGIEHIGQHRRRERMRVGAGA